MAALLRRIADGLTNVITGLGTSADARRGRAYTPNIITEDQVAAAYSGSAMLRKAIRIPALDMTREWRDWQAEAKQIEALEAEERRLSVQAKVLQAEVLRGLGGGALILGAPGNPASPIGAVGKGGLAYLHVVSRWQLGLGRQVMDPADLLFGGPEHFTLSTTGGQVQLHPSRVVAFRGEPLPLHTAIMGDDWFWGDGRVGTLIDPAMNLDEALASFAALIKDARNIDIGVPKLMEMVATVDGEATLTKRLQLVAAGQSVIRATVYDAGDGEGKGGETISRHQVTWTGIPDVISAYAQALAAASDIPVTRLWGTSAKGLNATGEGDDRDWNKMVGARQRIELRPCLDQIDALLIPSALGSRPAEIWWKFAPLSIPTEKEEADRFKTTMEAAEKLQTTGAIPDVAFTKGMQNLMSEEGWMPGLDAALAELPEDERFGLGQDDLDADEPDPSMLQAANENDPVVPRARAAADRRFTDAAPRTLYVQRKLLNAADLIRWAKAQGFETTTPADEMHVTIAYSRQALDWMQIGADWSSDAAGHLTVAAGGPRIVEPLGDKGAVVLLFGSQDLTYRHQRILEAGASFDFAEYQPHVTITYSAPPGFDPSKVEPFVGPLKFGPELFSEIDEDWASGITEDQEVGDRPGLPFVDAKRTTKAGRLARRVVGKGFDVDQPRDRHGKWIPAGARNLISDAAAGRTSGKSVVIGRVGARAERMASRAGASIADKSVSLDPSMTRHIIIRHGAERRSGQKSVRAGDIAAAATLLNAARTMRRGRPAKNGAARFSTMTISKGQRIYAVFEARKTTVALVTMWVRK